MSRRARRRNSIRIRVQDAYDAISRGSDVLTARERADAEHLITLLGELSSSLGQEEEVGDEGDE